MAVYLKKLWNKSFVVVVARREYMWYVYRVWVRVVFWVAVVLFNDSYARTYNTIRINWK